MAIKAKVVSMWASRAASAPQRLSLSSIYASLLDNNLVVFVVPYISTVHVLDRFEGTFSFSENLASLL
jgi:hypothetical protein